MDNMETRVAVLEKKVKYLSAGIVTICFFLIGVIVFGNISFENYATAQQIRRDNEVYTSSIPSGQNATAQEIRARAFVLVDARGKTRGMWTAENNNTTLGLGYGDNKDPSVVLSVGEDYASVVVSDRNGNAVAMSSDEKLRSVAITENQDGNRVYLGSSGRETMVEFKSTASTSLSLNSDGETSIQTLGGKSDFVLAEKRGSFVRTQTDSDKSSMVFADKSHVENLSFEVKSENPNITITSPLYKSKRVISVNKDEK